MSRRSPTFFLRLGTRRSFVGAGRSIGFGWLAALLVAVVALGSPLLAAPEKLPPPPPRHFNDFAGIVPAAAAASIDSELAQFERDTSNQILVAVYPRMESGSSVQDYTFRVAQSWHPGQKGRDNGAVLFVFLESHDLYIQVGYGLEPVLTDATCFQIIQNEIKPRFRANDFTGGLRAGTRAMMSAARGEYKGTGRTNAEAHTRYGGGLSVGPFIFFLLVMLVLGSLSRRNRNYSRRGWNSPGGGFGPGGFGGGFGGFGGGGGGGSSSSGGGGFSGGGGNFGGGGAGGRW